LSRSTTVPTLTIAVAVLVCGALADAQQPSPNQGASASQGDDPLRTGALIWDANHDGIYTCDEWKAYLDRLFTAADRNRNGILDPTEFTIIRKASATLADADFGYFDENQDGKITRQEFVSKPSEFILRFDKNGDCRVTPDEMNATAAPQATPRGGKKR
jgi:EF hand